MAGVRLDSKRRMTRIAVPAIQALVAVTGVVAWGVLLRTLLDVDTTTWLMALVLADLVPLLLLATHAFAGFDADQASSRRWAWVLASSTWLPPVAVVVAYPYLEAAGARRRPNPYGIITDPPREWTEPR